MHKANDDGGPDRVLIVDDCADNRRLVATCLGAVDGVVAEEAGDAWSALRMMVKRVPDLLILDMDLPLLSGYQTTRMVRAWGGRFADLPILAITAAPALDAHAQCLDAGANDFMAKPLSPTTLRTKVRAALGHAI
jgi:CheY-like chemotaxis protein